MGTPLRFGLVGVGNHGPFYQKFARGTGTKESGGVIVALADTDESRLRQAASELGVAEECCYTDYQRLKTDI